MPRPKSFVCRKFFTTEEGTNHNKCSIKEKGVLCGRVIKSDHASNLRSHIKSLHKETWAKIEIDEQKQKATEKENVNKQSVKNFLSPQISISMTRDDLLNNCVEMCSVNGRPFSIVEDSGFIKIIQPISKGLGDFSINRRNIKDAVFEKYKKVTNQIISEVQGKLICIKIDGLTHLNRSFLGINAQFISNGKIVLRTLAVAELFDRHTGEYLKDVIVYTLNKYMITIDQVYSCTTDNGRNMVKCIDLMNELSEDTENCLDLEEENDLEVAENDCDFDDKLEEFQLTSKCIGVRCAAHTLQLAINSILKTEEMLKITSIARNVIKKLRTPNINILLKDKGLTKPLLDCITRWSSTFDMLSSLIEPKMKEFCNILAQSNREFYISEEMWEELSQAVKVLQPANVATKILQKEQLTFGDAYDAWYTCKIQIKKIKTSLALNLYEKIEMKEEQLFENDAFISAIFIDPRWNVVLKGSLKERAIEHIILTLKKINSIKQNDVQIVDNDNKEADNDLNSESSFDCLEEMLKSIERENVGQNQTIRDLLNNFLKEKRVPLRENVLEWWEERKSSKPELYEVAIVLLAVPATQVSVERLFSGVKFIMNPLRNRLDEDALNSVLVLRANKDLF